MNRSTRLLIVIALASTVGIPSIGFAQEAITKFPPAKKTESKPLGKLVWQDEFNGPTLDYSKWESEVNGFGGGNEELQLYTDRKENLRVEDGCLVIEARRDKPNVSGTEREYSSARVRTKHRGDWKYGRVEVRAKLAKGAGVWPAIWMLPTDDQYGGWAASGEIDIMELKGQEPNKVLGTLHYGGHWPKNKYTGDEYVLPTGSFADSFHTFAVEWTEGRIDWFVDGVHYETQTKWDSVGGSYPAPFDQRFHLLINLAVGGHFVGPTNDQTVFPQKMQIDWVRVYSLAP